MGENSTWTFTWHIKYHRLVFMVYSVKLTTKGWFNKIQKYPWCNFKVKLTKNLTCYYSLNYTKVPNFTNYVKITWWGHGMTIHFKKTKNKKNDLFSLMIFWSIIHISKLFWAEKTDKFLKQFLEVFRNLMGRPFINKHQYLDKILTSI